MVKIKGGEVWNNLNVKLYPAFGIAKTHIHIPTFAS
jgi:hypothetical protein